MRKNPYFRAYLALAAVCFFWGTTYLGIRIALESFPPAALISMRFTLSGAILLAVAFVRKDYLPRGRELWITALCGISVLGVGTGTLIFAEQWIPSGLAALFITTSPFWMVGVEALFPGGERLHAPSLAGMLVGLCGTLLLVAPSAIHNGFSGPVLKAFLVLQLGCLWWAIGSITQRRVNAKAHPIVSGAIQQFAAGLAFLIPACFEHVPFRWNARGISAVVYLVVFGSIVGYSAFIFAMDRLPVSIVSIYTYVNPVVAVSLGWLFFREAFGLREVSAMLVIFLGVALVKRFGGRAREKSRTQESPPAVSSREPEPRHTSV